MLNILGCMNIARLAFVLAFASVLPAQQSRESLLDRAEHKLRAIYERGEFRARGFRARWLPDSSAYVFGARQRGRGRGGRGARGGQRRGQPQRGPIKIDAVTGKRGELTDAERAWLNRSDRHSPDGRFVIGNERGNLVVRPRGRGRPTRLTNNAKPGDIRNGQAIWSPDGQRIAFVESDVSGVRKRSYLVPGDPSYPGVRETRFARVGGQIPMLRVGVVEAKGGATRWLDLERPDEGIYLGQVEWAGNSHEVLVERLSRGRDEREFLLFDVRSGAKKRIFHEKDKAWVVASYGVNKGLIWIEGGEAFVVIHERDAWRHAYRYSRDGGNETLMTPGAFDIIERGVVDHASYLYYYASPDNAAQKYLYRVHTSGKRKPERITPKDQPGTHEYAFSPDGRYAFHTYSTFDTPPVTELVELPSHRVVRVLVDNNALRAKAKASGYRRTEFLKLEIGDGITLDAWLMKPPGFDPQRKYPVLVYVYSEPHAQTVLDAWGRSHAAYHRMVSDLGYLVVSIDSRGTPAPKGAAWRRAIFPSLGPLSTREQAVALRELARKRSYVDLSRTAIWGWSGGGSNTLNAMFREPDLYKVGIAVAAKPQPHLYNAWFQEIYMRTRESNPEGYERSAPINFAEGLKGKLLIIHGSGELNTHIQITEGLVDRLIELGKRFDYMTYPNRRHGLREGRGTSVHLRMLMVRYLLDHLPPGPR